MIQEQLEEGQIVLCTVEKIIGTTVFVKIQDNREGTITTSEISPGRIRNLRDYVVPGKKIVCKILRIDSRGTHLSLRRVKQNERKELLNNIAKERGFEAILKTVLGKEKTPEVIEKITQEQSILDFFGEIRQTPDLLEKYTNKEEASKIIKILESKKEKPKEIRQIFKISNKSSSGINIVKKILESSCKGTSCETSYLSAGRYRITLRGEDFKKLKTENNKIIKDIEKQAKKNHCKFSVEKH